jgi:hypothetical protein
VGATFKHGNNAVAPRWDQDAEQSVLGAVLLRNDAITRTHLDPEDFFDPRHRYIWGAMLELAHRGKPIDPLLLEDALGGRMAAIGHAYLSQCVGIVPTADNIEHYAEIVADTARTRRVRLALSALLESELEGQELLERTARDLAPLLKARAGPLAAPLIGQLVVPFLGDEDDTAEDDSGDWLVRGIVLRAAPNIIGGTPKSKKTMLAIHLAISIAAGLPTWLGRFPIKQGRVLILAHEDSKRETQRRIWRLARGLGFDPRNLDATLRIADRSDPFHFDIDAEMARMVATIEAWRPAVIFMDSLSRMHMGDENSVREMNAVTSAWLTLAARYDLAIVTIHHLTKVTESKSLIMQLRGSGDIGAAVRHAVGCAKNEKDPDRVRVWTDGNSQYQPEPFDVVVADDTNEFGKPVIVLEVQDAEDAKSGIIRAAILAALADGPRSSRQLRDACKGMRAVAVDEAARALAAEGKTRRLGGMAHGPWVLV